MTGLEKLVATAIRTNCPYTHFVNENSLIPITRRLIKTNGVCPCAHSEWTDDTPEEDKHCPCITFRKTGECHCTLYLPSTKPYRE